MRVVVPDANRRRWLGSRNRRLVLLVLVLPFCVVLVVVFGFRLALLGAGLTAFVVVFLVRGVRVVVLFFFYPRNRLLSVWF